MDDIKIICRALIVDDQNRLLLVKKADSDFWSLPGGKLDVGDENVRTCLVRELREELDVEATIRDIRFVQELHKNGTRYIELIWQAMLASDPVSNRNRIGEISHNELIDIQWIKKSEMRDINVKPELLKELA